MNPNRKLVSTFGFLLLCQSAFADVVTPPVLPDWETWVNQQSIRSVDSNDTPILQNPAISRESRLQIVGPSIGIAERRDFQITTIASVGVRYHLSENHGWEIFRYSYSSSHETALAQEIREKTSFIPDVKTSRHQISSSYIYSPVYGKYALSSSRIVYFDAFLAAGAGIRFADAPQVFGEVGLGMNHFVFSKNLALLPEVRIRFYSENRSTQTVIFETLAQLGVSWIF